MTYLTKAPVHELLQRGMHNINDPHNRHRAVMSLFGSLDSDSPRKQNGILYRLERMTTEAAYYLVRSQTPIEKPTPGTITREESIAELEQGDVVQFRIAVNAVVRHTDNNGCKSKIIIKPVQIEATPQWTAAKLNAGLTDVSITRHNREFVGLRNQPNGKQIQIDLLDGFARVDDWSVLRQMLLEGVGRAKAYGCGLLTIRRA